MCNSQILPDGKLLPAGQDLLGSLVHAGGQAVPGRLVHAGGKALPGSAVSGWTT